MACVPSASSHRRGRQFSGRNWASPERPLLGKDHDGKPSARAISDPNQPATSSRRVQTRQLSTEPESQSDGVGRGQKEARPVQKGRSGDAQGTVRRGSEFRRALARGRSGDAQGTVALYRTPGHG